MNLPFLISLSVLIHSVALTQVDSIYCVKQTRLSGNQIDYQKFKGDNLLSEVTVNLLGDTIGWIDVIETKEGQLLYQYGVDKLDTTMFYKTVFNLENEALFSVMHPDTRPDTTFYEENEFGDLVYSRNRELVHYERDHLQRKTKEWYGAQINNYKTFEYNENGQKIKQSYHNENPDYSYYIILKYDSNGNLIEDATFSLQHLPLGINFYEYDENSFLTKEWGYMESPFIPENRWEIQYEKIKCP